MPAVCNKRLAVRHPQCQRARKAELRRRPADRELGRPQAEAVDLDRQRKAPELPRRACVSSAITIMRADAAATIFSRSSAPPPPLIRSRPGSISSAPSIVRSSSGVSSSVDRRMPSSRQSAAVRSEVGTPTIVRPAATLLGEQPDEFLRGRAGADAEPHAVADMGERGPRRLDLQRPCVHRMRFAANGCRGAPSIFAWSGKGFLRQPATVPDRLAHAAALPAQAIGGRRPAARPSTFRPRNVHEPADHRVRPRRDACRHRARPAGQPQPYARRRRRRTCRPATAFAASSVMAGA